MKEFSAEDQAWLIANFPKSAAECKWWGVIVYWHDSLQPTSEWEFLEDVVAREAFTIRSAGWVIGVSKTAMTIAQSISTSNESKRQVNGLLTIPFCAIIAVEVGS